MEKGHQRTCMTAKKTIARNVHHHTHKHTKRQTSKPSPRNQKKKLKVSLKLRKRHCVAHKGVKRSGTHVRHILFISVYVYVCVHARFVWLSTASRFLFAYSNAVALFFSLHPSETRRLSLPLCVCVCVCLCVGGLASFCFFAVLSGPLLQGFF
jgi:hypothetical protein